MSILAVEALENDSVRRVDGNFRECCAIRRCHDDDWTKLGRLMGFPKNIEDDWEKLGRGDASRDEWRASIFLFPASLC